MKRNSTNLEQGLNGCSHSGYPGKTRGTGPREGKMEKGRNRQKITGAGLFAILFVVSGLIAGCSSSGGGSSVSGTVSGKATITTASGGAISVNLGDGTSVILELPEGALAKSQDVTLSVSPQGAASASAKSGDSGLYPKLAISVTPAADLLECGTLTIIFPVAAQNVNRCIMQRTGSSDMIPVKQGFVDNELKASLYRLGELECSIPDISAMVTEAYRLMNETPDGTWQDAYAVFDALVYFSNIFNANDRNLESQECFNAVDDLCRQSAEAFLASPEPSGDDKDDLHVEALKKFRRLMVLCENPGDIVASFDLKLLISDSE